ncbi:MAG: nicotinate-nucleotide--dimethylbenzimidazole phosphoribosyltransferase [Dehalococcoidia bacterium]
MSEAELRELARSIGPLDGPAMDAARDRQARLTKPPGSLGRLEELSIWLAGVTGKTLPTVEQKLIVTAAADHGVALSGVSAYPRDVTAQMVLNFLRGGAAVNVLARQVGARVVVVDAGVDADLPDHPMLVRLSQGRGTADFSAGPAMSREQAVGCLLSGARLAADAIAAGVDLLAAGDMGIGNTTASAAITAVFTGLPVAAVTGRGTGIDDARLQQKVALIERALELNRPNPADGVGVLAGVGGFEIGVLAGVLIGAAAGRRPALLDGFISGAAGLIACAIAPGARDYLLASHCSAELGHRALLDSLGKRPLLDLGMRLGEGTGAALAIGILEAAAHCLAEMATFAEAGVSDSDQVRRDEG